MSSHDRRRRKMNANRYRWIALIGLVATVALFAAGCAAAPATPMAQEGAAGERVPEMEEMAEEPAAAEVAWTTPLRTVPRRACRRFRTLTSRSDRARIA
jgi:hypothetical protein